MSYRTAAAACTLMVWLVTPALAADRPPTPIENTQEIAPVIHPRLHAFMTERPAEAGRVWVYFADHGQTRGLQVPLTARAIERRLRHGIPVNSPERQPVDPAYVARVRDAGAHVHRVSRWLNAVSVDYEPDLVDRVARLPFVESIEPVARFFQAPEPEVPAAESAPRTSGFGASALNYGQSLEQLQQISVDAVHARGYTGGGVLVALFDTGFRKDHDAFQAAVLDGRLIAEWDFIFDDGEVQNELEDVTSAHNHGTSTWSVLGGSAPGKLYGPAFGASFLLAKTEDIRSETPVEEDNWLAAVEWTDSLGGDVISSSLSYSDWYVYAQYDGRTAVTTVAANLATSLGIVVCNSAGNGGPSPASIGAPVDAFGILSVGSVTSTGGISSFSSRGPTADGRIKPEVCARGSLTYLASASGTSTFGSSNGTSFSCPLVAGCAALILEVHPDWNPLMVREALMQTGDRASTPGNTFGWGIVNADAAIDYTGSIETVGPALPDTLLSYDESLTISLSATSASAVDPQTSSLYVRYDGGSYQWSPLVAGEGDTLESTVPAPTGYESTVELYLVIRDSVGFTARVPEPLDQTVSFVWQTLLPGDVNKDLSVTAGDIIALVDHVFRSATAPDPLALGDVDGTASITSADIVYLVNFVFKGGPPPVLP